jgi:hypothetical protein
VVQDRLQHKLCSSFGLVGGLYSGLFVGAHLRNQDSDFRLINGQRRGCDCRFLDRYLEVKN